MNTMLFKSAYDKVRLSEEFKAMAKQRLMQFVESHDIDLANTDAGQARAYTVIEKKNSAWKKVLGFGTLAAAVAVAVLVGVRPWDNAPIDTSLSPLSSGGGSSQEVIVDKLIGHSITFPAYIDEQVEFNYIVSETEPFEFEISLPESWEIVIPEGSERMGKSMVFIMVGDECVGSIDCGIYKDLTGDEYGFDGVEYGHPEYQQMVVMDIMNVETRNDWMPDFIEREKVTGEWVMQSYDIEAVEDYNELKAEETMTAATCTIYRNISDPAYSDRLDYGSGIIAFDPDRLVYVTVCFADMLKTELHNEIAKSVEISGKELLQSVQTDEDTRQAIKNGITVALTKLDTLRSGMKYGSNAEQILDITVDNGTWSCSAADPDNFTESDSMTWGSAGTANASTQKEDIKNGESFLCYELCSLMPDLKNASMRITLCGGRCTAVVFNENDGMTLVP